MKLTQNNSQSKSTMKKDCDKVRKNDKLPPLISEISSQLRYLSKSRFATATYSEVESSGPASSPLGFPAPRGEFI